LGSREDLSFVCSNQLTLSCLYHSSRTEITYISCPNAPQIMPYSHLKFCVNSSYTILSEVLGFGAVWICRCTPTFRRIWDFHGGICRPGCGRCVLWLWINVLEEHAVSNREDGGHIFNRNFCITPEGYTEPRWTHCVPAQRNALTFLDHRPH
jgi:hypothetical protein